VNSIKVDAVLQMLCVEIRVDDNLYIQTYAHRFYKIMLFINMSPSTCFSINRHSQGDVNTKEYIISVHQSYMYNIKSTYQPLQI
jgi:hypothetical protein